MRLFNPFVRRRWRGLDCLGDFARLNRCMHNKSFTAYNQVTVIVAAADRMAAVLRA